MNSNLIGYLAFGFAIAASLLSLLSMRASAAAFREASVRNVQLVAMKRLTDIEVELTELVDSMSSLHVSLKKLRSRIGMRNVRTKRNGDDVDVPDSREDPDGFKRAMRIKLANQRRV